MVWRKYPFDSIWNDMENMRAERENIFQMASSGADYSHPAESPTGCFLHYEANSGLK
jgi:hypothetical protein